MKNNLLNDVGHYRNEYRSGLAAGSPWGHSEIGPAGGGSEWRGCRQSAAAGADELPVPQTSPRGCEENLAVSSYRMPAEWEPHEATWLAWPRPRAAWSGRQFDSIRRIFLGIIEAILNGEKIHLLIAGEKEQDEILRRLKDTSHLDRLIFHKIPARDIWIRDYGPVFLKNKKGKKAWCKWRFNAWGGKYKALAADDKIFDRRLVPYPDFKPGIVLEGGSIEVNGRGICLVTEQCLLNPNRNPHLSRFEIENYLKNFLGLKEIVWLGRGIAGDDTDGHIDQLARFVNTDTILVSSEKNTSDENYQHLKESWERLKRFKEETGKPWRLARLPMPREISNGKKRLPASYANFYIANKAVLVPVFPPEADPPGLAGGRAGSKDKYVLGIFRDYFPGREIIPIPSGDLIYGLGGIHCMTQQEPA